MVAPSPSPTGGPAAEPRPDLFDRGRRRAAQARGARLRADGADAVLVDRMAEELAERLAWVQRRFERALVIGSLPDSLAEALDARGVAVTGAGPVPPRPDLPFQPMEEDALTLEPGSADLILALGTLDSVNDLPGALIQLRRTLRPDGLFLGACLGGPSLPRLRAALMAADEAVGRGVAARLHPQIDVRAVGDLLQRTGFAMPVADADTLALRYPHLPGLIADLRAHGWTSALAGERHPLSRAGLAAALSRFAADADPDGKTAETFTLLYLSGWAPSPDQPKPARRGSGQASLATVLGQFPPR